MGARSRLVAVLAVTLLLLPLLAVPLFLLGGRVADALDDDASNGVFSLDLVLGIGGPGLLAVLVAYRKVTTPIAVALGIASSLIAVGVLLVAFLVYCDAVNCDL